MPSTKITIRITENRGSITIDYSAVGAVVGLLTGDVRDLMLQQAMPPKTGSKAWWESVLNTVLADIIAGHGGGT
jgi:hypothetical protein